MSSLSILLIAIGLSFDCFTIAVTCGCLLKEKDWKSLIKIALFFGAFHVLMPLVGWLFGSGFKRVIADYDHWVAFALLSAIGLKMIWEGIIARKKEETRQFDPLKFSVLIGLSFAGSIDALAVGISLAILDLSIIFAAAMIGTIAFVVSFAGGYTGRLIGHRIRFPLIIPGGFVLIVIGIKILLEHLHVL